MNVSYYPGCSLDGTGREYGESMEAVAKTLGVELEELPDWTCCGSSSAHVTSDKLATSLAGRNLIIADNIGMDLIVPCAACFQRLKSAEKQLKAGQQVAGIPHNYQGKFAIKHSADFFSEDIDEKAIAARVKKPLTGLNPVCYYGCLTSRPQSITDAKNPEDPQSVDNLMALLGADVKSWSYKTDCCGGNLILTHEALALKLVQKLLDAAREAGADCIVAGCPMCQSNLDTRQKALSQTNSLPVFYFTELMGLAFGNPSVEKWLNRHFVDPKPLLQQKGLL
jgi:heterodisulfide reductase subunit B2